MAENPSVSTNFGERNMKTVIKFWAVCAVIVTANAIFISAQEKKPVTTNRPAIIESVKPDASNIKLPTDTAVAEVPNPYKNQTSEKYRIGFQDTIEVQVFRHPELSQVININPDGTIRMPRVKDPIIAACKTEGELENTITAHYKSYLKDPFVRVKAVDQRSQPFAVVGAVEKPGNFYLNRKVRLLELLAFAGGPDVEFSGTKIQVARTGSIMGCAEAAETAEGADKIQFMGYRLNDVLAGKENPWMEPGDIVSVLPAEEAYVVGNVVKPTKVVMKEPMSLTQALAAAGGISSTAKTDKILIQRQDASGNKVTLSFNLKDIITRKIADPQLQGNDIVQVDTDRTKNVIKGVTEIFKNGLPSIFYRVQ